MTLGANLVVVDEVRLVGAQVGIGERPFQRDGVGTASTESLRPERIPVMVGPVFLGNSSFQMTSDSGDSIESAGVKIPQA